MLIETIKLKNFRSYAEAEISPCPGVTVFTGDNAQGKTNILEAVYLTCTGRSHRTTHDRELIRNGEELGRVEVSGRRRDGRHDVEIVLSRSDKRRIKVGGSPITKSGELLGHITGVLFAPEDLRTVKDGPAERRRFVDMELSQLRPSYYYALQAYNRALKQRNALLRECAFNAKSVQLLDVWDEQLASSGSSIMLMRADFIKKLAGYACDIHNGVSDGREALSVVYRPDVVSEADPKGAIIDALLMGRENDLRRQTTGEGPHRDDVGILINGMDARVYGSQGQVRTCALSLKLSEIELMRQESGEAPVLMLDDVMSELDPSRRRMLISRLEGVQTFVTCTDREDLAGAEIGRQFIVNAAKLTEV